MGLFPGKAGLLWRAFRRNGAKGLRNVLNRFLESRNRREASGFVPFSAQVEVTTKCNLRCEMCEHSHWTERPEDLSFEDFRKIVDNNPFLLTLNLTGIGESLLNPDFFKMVEYAKSRGIFVWFNDNMTLMREENAKRVIESGVDVLAISLDGATRKTYEGIRQGADFGVVMQNIMGLARLKRLMKSRTPRLFISFVVMPQNYREMAEVVAIANRFDIESVVFVGSLEFEQNKKMGFKRIDIKDYEKYEARALRAMQEFGVDMRLPSKRQEPMPYSQCMLPWESPYINHRGEVLPCCFATQRNDPKLYKASVLGNAIKEPFEKIWNNEKYRALRRSLLQNKPVPICQGCAKVKGY